MNVTFFPSLVGTSMAFPFNELLKRRKVVFEGVIASIPCPSWQVVETGELIFG